MESNSTPRRHVSVLYVVMVAVAMVVGAGIFRSPAEIAANAGSSTWFFAAWIAGGLISLAGALCFAELATMLPSAGGDYYFLKTTYGRNVAFLFAWARFAVINTGSLALLGFVLGDYANSVWPLGAHGSSWYALITIVAMTVFNLKGLYTGQSADYAMTGLEVGGLLIVFAAGVALAIAGAPPLSPRMPGQTAFRAPSVSRCCSCCSHSAAGAKCRRCRPRFATSGVAWCVRWSRRSSPSRLSIYWRTGRCGVASEMAGLAASRTPASDVIARAFGDWAGVLTAVAIAMATLTSINATIVVGARTTYAAAADWPALRRLGNWNTKRGIPVAGIVSQGIVGILLVGLGTYTRDGFITMVDYSSPVFWLFLTLSGFAVILLRRRHPEIPTSVPRAAVSRGCPSCSWRPACSCCGPASHTYGLAHCSESPCWRSAASCF